MAANLAVLCKMNVDEFEDVKMAAEEVVGTQKDSVDIMFTLKTILWLILTWVMRIQLSLRQQFSATRSL